MSIVLLVMTDGRRDCLIRTLASFDEMVTGPVARRVIHDDSGDVDYRAWLADTLPGYELVVTPGRSGFGGAIRSAWRHLTGGTDERFVFHLEDDFLFTRPVDLDAMAAVLSARSHLAQMALRRQPWNATERAAGGVVEVNPDAYVERTDQDGLRWLEHRLFFTTNPSLYRRQLCAAGWPEGQHSEGHFGFALRERGLPWGPSGDAVRFGFWGSRDEGRDWVWHIGDVRVGTGY